LFFGKQFSTFVSLQPAQKMKLFYQRSTAYHDTKNMTNAAMFEVVFAWNAGFGKIERAEKLRTFFFGDSPILIFIRNLSKAMLRIFRAHRENPLQAALRNLSIIPAKSL